jgi:hypothetical protein
VEETGRLAEKGAGGELRLLAVKRQAVDELGGDDVRQ